MTSRPRSRSKSTHDVPRALVLFTLTTAAAALAALLVLPWARAWRVDAAGLFLVLSAFVLVGELMPIPVPHRHGLAKVTISTTFAFAILLRFGAAPALAVYVMSLVIADVASRVTPIKLLFNAAQYALAILAAAAVLAAAHV